MGTRLGRWIGQGAALVLVLAGCAVAAQGQAAADGPARWDKPVLTVHVTDEAAWAGTDVQGALDQWSAAFPMVLTDDTNADVTLDRGIAADTAATESADMVGATSTQDTNGATITHCRVGVADRSAGKDVTAILTHELGHCLGLGHTAGLEGGSVMHWFARDYQGGWSDTVTASDLTHVRSLYR